MADAKITALTENTAPLITDIIPIVDDPAGTESTQKLQLVNLLKIISGLTADTAPDLSADYVATYDASAGAVKKVLLSALGGSGINTNVLINGGMRVAQLGAGPFTSATTPANSDDTYMLDGVILLSDGNDIVDVSQVADTDFVSGYKIRLDVETANKRFGILMPVENKDIQTIRKSGKASLQFKVKCTGTSMSNVRAYLLAWDSTADSITSDVISAWGSAGSDPTFASNWTAENAASNLSINTSVATKEIENITVDTASVANLAVLIIVNDTDATVGDYLEIGDVKLESGTTCTDYVNEPCAVEFEKCLRLFEVLGSETGLEVYGAGQCASTTRAVSFYPFKVIKRVAPTVTLSAASHWAYVNASILAFVTWVTVSPQTSIYGTLFDVSGMAASLPGAGYATLFGPNGTTSAKIYFDARL